MNIDIIPEGCKLVATHTGDGWVLTVEDSVGETICFLAWPETWPASVTTEQIESFGFEVI